MGETEDYNFDFVNDASAMKLTVGDTEYEAVKISENGMGLLKMKAAHIATRSNTMQIQIALHGSLIPLWLGKR